MEKGAATKYSIDDEPAVENEAPEDAGSENNGAYCAKLMDDASIRALRRALEKTSVSMETHGHLREFQRKPEEPHPLEYASRRKSSLQREAHKVHELQIPVLPHRPASARPTPPAGHASRSRPSTVHSSPVSNNKVRRSFQVVLAEEKANYTELEDQYLTLKDAILRHFDDLVHNPHSVDRDLSADAYAQLAEMDERLREENRLRPQDEPKPRRISAPLRMPRPPANPRLDS